MKPEFLAEMTHELRSPLNTILGFAELMHDGSVGPIADDHKEYLADILTSGRHLLRMIDGLLAVAKLEAGQIDHQAEAIDVAAVIAGARDLVEGRAAHRHIKIKTDIADVGDIVHDAARFQQVVFDALSNAVNSTPLGGVVTLKAGPAGTAHLQIDVESSAPTGNRVANFSAVLPRVAAVP